MPREDEDNAHSKLFACVEGQETRKQSVLWEMWKLRMQGLVCRYFLDAHPSNPFPISFLACAPYPPHCSCTEQFLISDRWNNGHFGYTSIQQGSFLHEHARPLNKRYAWRLTTGSAFIKMARLKAIVAIIFLVGLGECARDLTKCVVCKKKL